MKEAIANAGIFNLIIIFVIILLSFFIGSLGYSKAFKVKNKIIDEIEKDAGYNEITEEAIEKWLGEIGYRMNTDFDSGSCPEQFLGDVKGDILNTNGDYQYCVYKFEICRSKDGDLCIKNNTNYRVITYMYFDLPIINQLIRLPVVGETKTFVEINS